MFTGIIESVGQIQSLDRRSAGVALRIKTGFSDLALGESVAVNGVCLTVAEQLPSSTTLFFVSPETLARTGLGELKARSLVNLERALLPHTRLSGHIVQGHVDGLARLLKVDQVGEAHHKNNDDKNNDKNDDKNDNSNLCYELTFELPESLTRYVVEKGSITLDGVSLTVNEIKATHIKIMLIPHTWTHTAFAELKPGAFVNVEVDVMAKYLEKLCQPYLKH